MAGPWDALGRGVSGGVDAYLRGKERQEDEKRRIATESMDRERLGLAQFQTRTGMERYEDEAALAEQLRAKERHEEYDPRTDPTRDIFIPMYETLAEGVFVPLSQEKRDQMYGEQLTAWENKEAGLAGTEHQRRLDELEYAAKMQHQYSYPPSHIAAGEQQEQPFFVNGAINEAGAFRGLQDFIQTYAQGNQELFWKNPELQQRFLDDISLRYSREVPGAVDKARAWLYQQAIQAGGPPPAEPSGSLRTMIEQKSREMHPDWPEAIIQQQVEDEYAQYLRAQSSVFQPAATAIQQAHEAARTSGRGRAGLFTPPPSVGSPVSPPPSSGPSMSAPPTQAPLMAPQAQAPAVGKTYEEFAAEKIAASPYLQGRPAAIQMLYQQYLIALRQR